ncbi:C40 family peptidase [Nonomuraea sp. CA-141351]|uniref:C40 family peptidase n=1 Tax=Nonomuraea sp. CA-141351 TaxID=3239996 RepID=UPI003D8DCCB0
MIIETGVVAKAIAIGGGLVSGVVVLAGITGGAQYAASSSDKAKTASVVCGYASESPARENKGSSRGLSSTQMANAKVIVEIAIKLKLPRRAAEIALATALQESHLDNAAVGDHGESLGLFQQKPSAGWGTREQVTTPNHAARTFYERLVQVRGWKDMPLTKAAAIVQRPREDLRGEYAKHEPVAKRLVAALWSAKPTPAGDIAKNLGLTTQERARVQSSIEAAAGLGIPREAVVLDVMSGLQRKYGATSMDPADLRKQAEGIVNTTAGQLCAGLTIVAGSPRGAVAASAALAQRGIPYSWGGGGPDGPSYGIGRGAGTKGFDCSGLTEYAWSKAGIRIGSTTYQQINAGSKIPHSQIQPGDLVFYETDPSRSGPDHVGLAISNTEMVNAPYTGAVVRIDPIARRGYIGAVRPG